jgi:hypothetical protein
MEGLPGVWGSSSASASAFTTTTTTTTSTSTIGLLALAALTMACAAPPPPVAAAPPPRAPSSTFTIVAEGPCPKLSVHAIDDRRFLVFGDTGYDLRAWMPGDVLAAAQSMVELRADGAFVVQAMQRGLPRDGRGYVPGDLVLGGSFARAPWLLRIASEHAPSGTGALFARTSEGYLLRERGWERADGPPVERPAAAARLPELPLATMCGAGLTFVPIAGAPTPEGGLLVGGRCDDDRPANLKKVTLLVAHGAPGGTAWDLRSVPGTELMDGIVNVALFARSTADAVLVAYEPFKPPAERKSFAARWDGKAWRDWNVPVDEGLMSVAGTPDGALWLAASRAVHRIDAAGKASKVPLPPLRHARGEAEGLHLHTVRAFGAEVWIEGSYRVYVQREDGKGRAPMWASALFSNVPAPRPLYCDAREPADQAVFEVE